MSEHKRLDLEPAAPAGLRPLQRRQHTAPFEPQRSLRSAEPAPVPKILTPGSTRSRMSAQRHAVSPILQAADLSREDARVVQRSAGHLATQGQALQRSQDTLEHNG